MTESKTILIVDDEPDVITYLKAFFQDHGFSVISADNGKDGFSRALKYHPDLISLDITMPAESGVRMLRKLKEDSTTATIPVIIITGTPGDPEQLLGKDHQQSNIAGYFEKPVNRDLLLQKTREILGLKD
jgi:CheY-like chemotaxis protein